MQSEKLLFFCEGCEQMTCRSCQLSDVHRGHDFRPTNEVIPELKILMQEGASDIKLKKNILNENIALLDTKLTEVGIKVIWERTHYDHILEFRTPAPLWREPLLAYVRSSQAIFTKLKQFYSIETVDFNGILTVIVRIYVKHADHHHSPNDSIVFH